MAQSPSSSSSPVDSPPIRNIIAPPIAPSSTTSSSRSVGQSSANFWNSWRVLESPMFPNSIRNEIDDNDELNNVRVMLQELIVALASLSASTRARPDITEFSSAVSMFSRLLLNINIPTPISSNQSTFTATPDVTSVEPVTPSAESTTISSEPETPAETLRSISRRLAASRRRIEEYPLATSDLSNSLSRAEGLESRRNLLLQRIDQVQARSLSLNETSGGRLNNEVGNLEMEIPSTERLRNSTQAIRDRIASLRGEVSSTNPSIQSFRDRIEEQVAGISTQVQQSSTIQQSITRLQRNERDRIMEREARERELRDLLNRMERLIGVDLAVPSNEGRLSRRSDVDRELNEIATNTETNPFSFSLSTSLPSLFNPPSLPVSIPIRSRSSSIVITIPDQEDLQERIENWKNLDRNGDEIIPVVQESRMERIGR